MGDWWARQRAEASLRRRAFFSNWQEYDGPFGRKLVMTVKNRTKAFITLKGCCGNHGQPGC